jgi:hypothetical protein
MGTSGLATCGGGRLSRGSGAAKSLIANLARLLRLDRSAKTALIIHFRFRSALCLVTRRSAGTYIASIDFDGFLARSLSLGRLTNSTPKRL